MPHQEVQNPPEIAQNQQDLNYYHQMPMYPEHEHNIQHPYPHEIVHDTSPRGNLMLQDSYSGPAMYYNQNFSSIVTS